MGKELGSHAVRNQTFKRPPIGKRGYAEDEVDAYLQVIAAALDGNESLTANDVHNVIFGKPPIGKRGYDEGQVDAFLDAIENQLRLQERSMGDEAATANAEWFKAKFGSATPSQASATTRPSRGLGRFLRGIGRTQRPE